MHLPTIKKQNKTKPMTESGQKPNYLYILHHHCAHCLHSVLPQLLVIKSFPFLSPCNTETVCIFDYTYTYIIGYIPHMKNLA